jgi:hypothetical protein
MLLGIKVRRIQFLGIKFFGFQKFHVSRNQSFVVYKNQGSRVSKILVFGVSRLQEIKVLKFLRTKVSEFRG